MRILQSIGVLIGILFVSAITGFVGFIVLDISGALPQSAAPFSVASVETAANLSTSDSFIPPPVQTKNTTTILAFGDMMLDRTVRGYIDHYGADQPFLPVEELLKGNDVVVANAEGVFSDNTSVTLGVKNAPLRFTFEKYVIPTLKRIGFTVFSQANNHAYDFGQDGLDQSRAAIDAGGLASFGDPQNRDHLSYTETTNGIKVAFIGFHEFSYENFDNVLQSIAEGKAAGAFVIVYPHWGVEYNNNKTSSQQKMAHQFIDAGADLVLGGHPHVIEPVELYNGKMIFYSMGNFIFDQDFSLETKQGLAIRLTLSDTSLHLELIPLAIADVEASVMDQDQKNHVLNKLAAASAVSPELKNAIMNGVIDISR